MSCVRRMRTTGPGWHAHAVDLTRPHDAAVAPDADPQLRPPRYRVSTRARWYWLTRSALAWLVILAAEIGWFLPADWLHGWVIAVPVGTVLVAATHLTVMPQWRYRVHRYEVTDEAVYTQAGWLNQERRIAPISRVQTVDTARGPLEQLFRLANITVTTASSAGALEIKGLDRALAEQVVENLTSTTQATRGDAT